MLCAVFLGWPRSVVDEDPPDVRREVTGARGGEGGAREERADEELVSEAEARDFRLREGYRPSSVVVGERASKTLLRVAAVEEALIFLDLLEVGLVGAVSMLSKRGV
jgi:hypothetical protein